MHRLILALTCLAFLGGCESLMIRPAGTEPAALRQQADQAYQRGDWPKAERAYRELTELDPEEAESWYRLGNIYMHLDRPGEAFAAYGEALKRQPDHARAWHNLGILQLRQATRSFLYLEQVTQPGDPLHRRARSLIDGMTGLLEQEWSTAPPAGPDPAPQKSGAPPADQN